jgi:hypothetical protein
LTSPHSHPYLVDNFFYTAASPTNLVAAGGPNWSGTINGGPSGDGWFRALEFFEVPSPSFGSIGSVAQGNNFDWLRNDIKPGLLNLNLIIDEEVFLGLMGNAGWVSNNDATSIPPNTPQNLNANQMLTMSPETGQAGPAFVPKVVTMVDPSGSPALLSANHLAAYPMSNSGYFAYDPLSTLADSRLKAAFSDFLKLRHGGSGYLFAWGTGVVGQAPIALTSGQGNIASERPFHALSYPDINYTIMRPAILPPTTSTAFTPYPAYTAAASPAQPTNFVWDPGVQNPYLYNAPTATTVMPPATPPRRLFQIPDLNAAVPPTNAASDGGDVNVNSINYLVNNPAGGATPNLQMNLSSTYFDLTSNQAVATANAKLSGGLRRPYFRIEWLQKVTNLTTVRTHQYAVWITVGFFEVTRQGDPRLADTNPSAAMDVLGPELGVLTGKTIRYRSFFLIDRTKATGFNPYNPGDYRECVVFRQSIQ